MAPTLWPDQGADVEYCRILEWSQPTRATSAFHDTQTKMPSIGLVRMVPGVFWQIEHPELVGSGHLDLTREGGQQPLSRQERKDPHLDGATAHVLLLQSVSFYNESMMGLKLPSRTCNTKQQQPEASFLVTDNG